MLPYTTYWDRKAIYCCLTKSVFSLAHKRSHHSAFAIKEKMGSKKQNPVTQRSKHAKPVNSKKKTESTGFASRFKNQKLLLALSLLIPAGASLYYFSALTKHSIDFPFFDDFDALLCFLRDFHAREGFFSKFKLLFQQYNEHRIFFDRLVATLQYLIVGELDFMSLIIIGNGALLMITVFLYLSFSQAHKIHVIYLAPITFVIYNFRYFETIFWAMASLQNFWVLALALISLFFLFHNKPYSIYLAVLFGWMAAFSSGNGTITFIAGAIVLLLNRPIPKDKILIWSIAGLMGIAGYFYHFNKPKYSSNILPVIMDHPLEFMGYIFAYLGGAFTEDSTIAIYIGIALCVIALFLTYKQFYKSNPAVFAFMLFLLATPVLAGATRFVEFGLGQALASKYAITSSLLTACCYLGLASVLYKRINVVILAALTGLAFYFHTGTREKYLPGKLTEKKEFEKNYALVTQNKLSNFSFGWPQLDDRKNKPREDLRTADSLGYYKFKFMSEEEILNNTPTDPKREILFKLERFEQTQPNALVMSGWAFTKKIDPTFTNTVLCFKNEQGVPVKYFVCQKYVRQDVTKANAADNTNYDLSGFFTFFNPKEVPKGKYLLYIIMSDGNYKSELNTGQALNMQ